MREVRAKPIKEYFSRPGQGRDSLDGPTYFYYTHRRILNRLSLFALLIASAFLVGLWHRAGNVVGISLILLLVLLKVQARGTAEGLRISRRAPATSRELDEAKVEFEVLNLSGFTARNLLIHDHFSASREAEVHLWLEEPLRPNESFRGSYARLCDAGMGRFTLGPATVMVRDPLGIFEYSVTEGELIETEVHPLVNPIPPLPVHGSKDSFAYGIHDLPVRGASVNFIGLREYSIGDSLRHIAWKRSVRRQKLLVKEFEKAVNTEISILLDMNPIRHAGRKSESTWEYAKDAALSILAQQNSGGNSLQLLSDEVYSSFGRGEEHVHRITLGIFDLKPAGCKPARSLIDRYWSEIPSGTTAIYVGPVLGADFGEVRTDLLRLRHKGVEVLCLLIDAGSFLVDQFKGDFRLHARTLAKFSKEELATSFLELRSAGIHVYALEHGMPIGRSLLREGSVR